MTISSIFLMHFLLGLLILVVFVFLGVITAKLIKKIAKKYPERNYIIALLATIVKITLIVLGIITALGNMGVNLSALIAGLGITTLGLGLAFKDAMTNFVAGIMVFIYRPFKLNDTIKVADATGKVIDINLHYVTLQANGNKIIIPNTNIFNAPITILEDHTQ